MYWNKKTKYEQKTTINEQNIVRTGNLNHVFVDCLFSNQNESNINKSLSNVKYQVESMSDNVISTGREVNNGHVTGNENKVDGNNYTNMYNTNAGYAVSGGARSNDGCSNSNNNSNKKCKTKNNGSNSNNNSNKRNGDSMSIDYNGRVDNQQQSMNINFTRANSDQSNKKKNVNNLTQNINALLHSQEEIDRCNDPNRRQRFNFEVSRHFGPVAPFRGGVVNVCEDQREAAYE